MNKIIRIFAPITRVDSENRIVEGYAFVNEVVEGEGGIRLKRSAMEAATEDYMRWGAVRAMHQPIAAGTAEAVEWDEKGAFLRAKIVDDAEWAKVESGVYKGFSVGVRPRVVRGKSVEKCTWVENSLVDRPADPDAEFSIARADDADADIDVEIERGAFATQMEGREKATLRYAAMDVLASVLYDISYGTAVNKEELAREACAEFADYIAPIVARAEFADLERAASAFDPKPDEDEEEAKAEITRLAGELDRAAADLASAEAEINRLKAMPPKRVFKTGEGIDRQFLVNLQDGQKQEIEGLIAEGKAIMARDGSTRTENERIHDSQRISVIKAELTRLGESAPF